VGAPAGLWAKRPARLRPAAGSRSGQTPSRQRRRRARATATA
jgi:hypothetical protein